MPTAPKLSRGSRPGSNPEKGRCVDRVCHRGRAVARGPALARVKLGGGDKGGGGPCVAGESPGRSVQPVDEDEEQKGTSRSRPDDSRKDGMLSSG